MSRRHDNHTRLTLAGREWRVRAMRGLGCVVCSLVGNPDLVVFVDLTDVDWDLYTAAALEALDALETRHDA